MKTVLVVDDDPTIVLSLQHLLQQADYRVLVARDGQEALDLMRDEVPHLMLLDVMMPRLSGYDVCERVRASAAWRGVRILMLTARGGAVEARKALALGADDFMTKPFSTRELLDRVRALLDA